MVNETSALPMPGLIATGPDKMLEQTKTSGLIVPLKGYKVHVLGAATRGLTPQLWNGIKSFWSIYIRECGAELVSYSPEVEVSGTR